MKKIRSLFYYTSTGLALAYLLSTLLFFNVKYQMMVSISLIMYIGFAFGIALGVAFNTIKYPYLFFILEGLTLAIALVSNKLINLLYITKEALQLNISAGKLTVPLLVCVVCINLVNIYIVATLAKYQKVYTKAEKEALKATEVKLSDLKQKHSQDELTQIKHKRKILRVLTLVGFALFMGVYFLVPSFKTALNHAFATISKLDVQVVVDYLRSWGSLEMIALVSFTLMILQSIAAPIPAFLITLSNAVIFGWKMGALLSWSSAMVGAAVCFYIARVMGRDVVEKLTSKGAMASVDVFFERYGKYTILICRLLPFVSFDFVSYGAGLTNMGFWSFFIATGIGQLPATIVYSYVGGTLSGGAQKLFVGLLTLFALFIVIGIIKKVYYDKHKMSLSKDNTTNEP